MTLPALLSIALWAPPAEANEGMWLPEQLPGLADDLKRDGLALDPARLGDPLGDPLGAIVSLGWCSGSFVSADGLILTNHHCVAEYLQNVSTGAENRARDGFVASSRAEELPAGPTARLYLVESMKDVTSTIAAATKKAKKDADRQKAIEKASNQLVADCQKQKDRRCNVASFYGGLEYRLVTNREIRDVRLVFVPPESVGSYGGEIDNWMWPRHAGDFSVIRAYVAPDGSTADYAKENVPFKPAHVLQIGPGVKPGDLVFAAGFPWDTRRHRLAAELRYLRDGEAPREIEDYTESLDILHGLSDKDPEMAARLAGPIDGIANALKYDEGLLDNLAASDVLPSKEKLEADLDAWVAADPARKQQYGASLAELRSVDSAERAHASRDAAYNTILYSADLMGLANAAVRLADERLKPEVEREPGYQESDVPDFVGWISSLEHTWVETADREMLRAKLTRAHALPAGERIDPVEQWIAKEGGVDALVDHLYNGTALKDPKARLALLDANAAGLAKSTDPLVQFARALEAWKKPVRAEEKARDGALSRLRPIWQQALRAFAPGRIYPDANGTLRVTWGKVHGYEPADGVSYLPQTTVRGMVKKAGDAPFDAPQNLLQAAASSAKSPYVDPALADVPVDFLSDVDTTGGNSGSATLDANGRLVGLVFDGNYESMAADWQYDGKTTRTIHVDIRYVQWVIAQSPAASWVLDEMGKR